MAKTTINLQIDEDALQVLRELRDVGAEVLSLVHGGVRVLREFSFGKGKAELEKYEAHLRAREDALLRAERQDMDGFASVPQMDFINTQDVNYWDKMDADLEAQQMTFEKTVSEAQQHLESIVKERAAVRRARKKAMASRG